MNLGERSREVGITVVAVALNALDFAEFFRRNFVFVEIYRMRESMLVPLLEDTSCSSMPCSTAYVCICSGEGIT